MRFVSDELREASQDRIAFLTCVFEEISPDVKGLIPRGVWNFTLCLNQRYAAVSNL
jgi:hypothetical protein